MVAGSATFTGVDGNTTDLPVNAKYSATVENDRNTLGDFTLVVATGSDVVVTYNYVQ